MHKAKIYKTIFFFVCLAFAGCATVRPFPDLNPVKPSTKIEFQGFSIQSPQGDNWFVITATPYDAFFAKKLSERPSKKPHTILALIHTTVEEKEFKEPDAFLHWFTETNEINKNPKGRFKNSEFKAVLDNSKGVTCIRYDAKTEDRGVPGFMGSLFILDLHGVMCLHPDYPRLIVDVNYSQRTPDGEEPLFIEKESTPFLNSVKFTRLEKPFVTAMIATEKRPQGIDTGYGSLWLAQMEANIVSRIDPETNKVIAKIPVGKDPVGVAIDANAVWISNMSDNTVSKVDPSSNKVVATIPVGKKPLVIKAGFGSIWVTNNSSNTVSRIDPLTNEIVASIKVGSGPNVLAIGEGYVWVTHYKDDTVSRIDPATSQTIGEPIYSGKGATGCVIANGSLWVANTAENSVSRIDYKTGELLDKIPVGRRPSNLVAAEGSIWVTEWDDSTVARIDPDKNELTGKRVPVGIAPTFIVYGYDTLWVGNALGNSVFRIGIK